MHITAFALLAAIAASGAHAVVTYPDFDCQGDAQPNVVCDGACHKFSGHSFKANPDLGDPTTRCVTVYQDGECTMREMQYRNQAGGCTNVATGTPIGSYRCGQLNVCPA